MNQPYIKLEIFIPEEFVEELRNKFGEIGVGNIGFYDHCLSYTKVKGYWRPLEGANPFEGKIGEISSGEEVKVEVTCLESLVEKAMDVVKEVHPYDVPLINIIQLANHLYYTLD